MHALDTPGIGMCNHQNKDTSINRTVDSGPNVVTIIDSEVSLLHYLLYNVATSVL